MSSNQIVLCDNPKTVQDFFKKYSRQIAMALPKHLTPARMLRLTLTTINQTPLLKQCSLPSLFGAVIQASQLGLEIGNGLGHAYLVPFKKKGRDGTPDIVNVQLIVGYRGMIDLAYRSSKVKGISAHVVYDVDEFEFSFGIVQKLHHIPARIQSDNVIAAYMVANLEGGALFYDVMWKEELDAIRDKSANYSNWVRYGKKGVAPIWETHYAEMCKKTIIRRAFKMLPVSIEIQRAVAYDEAGDMGMQNNDNFLEIPAEEVEYQSTTDAIAADLEKSAKK